MIQTHSYMSKMRWKDSFGKVWNFLCRGMVWGFLLALLSGFFVNEKTLAIECKPSAIYYGNNAGSAPWNNPLSPETWTMCEANYTYDGVASCCPNNEIGMTQGQFLNESFQLTATGIVGIIFHSFFITTNIVIRKFR